VIVGSPTEYGVSSDPIILGHLGIKKPNARVSERTKPKVCCQTTEKRSCPLGCDSLHHADATPAKHYGRPDLPQGRVPMVLQTAHRLRIGREDSLEFVKDHELPIELSKMVKKRIP